ncbi:MAG TPA: hypothetical protein VN371_04910 [Chlorobaculum sp.]|nr:hypothetical protein [Chlorobaculum sp.]
MIADSGNVYGDRVMPGAVKLAGLLGHGASKDKVSGTATIANPVYGLSGQLNMGCYKQSLDTVDLSGEDACNYSISYTTERPNYTVSTRVVNLEGIKPYDGKVTFDASFFGDNGIISGVGSETLKLIGTGFVTSPNVEDGRQQLIPGDLRLTDGANGGLARNYTLVDGAHFATIITKKPR